MSIWQIWFHLAHVRVDFADRAAWARTNCEFGLRACQFGFLLIVALCFVLLAFCFSLPPPPLRDNYYRKTSKVTSNIGRDALGRDPPPVTGVMLFNK